MKLNDDAIKNLIGIQDIKQIRQGQLDGNKLKELIIKKHLISVTLGAIQKTKVVVALYKPIPNILIADYVLEMEEPYDFIVRIIKDILTRHTKIKGFNFNPVAKTCEFVILDNKPEKPELFKLRFMDNCFKPGQSGKLYQIFEYRG
ncbi:MAG: hypothetical protein N3A62_06385, partial [Thermodesulfovibrionales bacterium]|nr:hypothetical protein [Thermodesulfovibrionales bacterium]